MDVKQIQLREQHYPLAKERRQALRVAREAMERKLWLSLWEHARAAFARGQPVLIAPPQGGERSVVYDTLPYPTEGMVEIQQEVQWVPIALAFQEVLDMLSEREVKDGD